jgi:hypothetical protein
MPLQQKNDGQENAEKGMSDFPLKEEYAARTRHPTPTIRRTLGRMINLTAVAASLLFPLPRCRPTTGERFISWECRQSAGR